MEKYKILLCSFVLLTAALAANVEIIPIKSETTARIEMWHEVLDVYRGVLKGISAQTKMCQITSCLQEQDSLYDELNNAIDKLKSDDPTDVIQGIRSWGYALQPLANALHICTGVVADAQKLMRSIGILLYPKPFVYKRGHSLSINNVELYDDVATAVKAYGHAQWETFGIDLGEILVRFPEKTTDLLSWLHLDFIEAFKTIDPEVVDTDLFIKGLIEGVGLDLGYDEIAECVNITDEMGVQITEAVEDFITEDPSRVKAGLKLVGQAISELPYDMLDCNASEKDVAKMVQMIESFTDPEQFIFHVGKSLLVNGAEIYDEITEGVSDFQTRQWEKSGEDFGEALAEVVFTQLSLFFEHAANVADLLDLLDPIKNFQTVEPDVEDVELLLTGLLEGIGIGIGYDDIAQCVNITEEMAVQITEAVEDLESEIPDRVKAGLMLFGEVISELPSDMRDCEASEADVQKMEAIIESFKNPEEFIFYVGKSLIVNRVEIYDEVTEGVSDFESQQWEKSGIDFGEALAKIFLGDSAMLSQHHAMNLQKKVSWEVEVPTKFSNMTIEEIKRYYLGTQMVNYTDYDLDVVDYSDLPEAAAIPKSFNAYDKWPQCKHPIRDQGQCGSCWAFGASETLSDRVCIASKAKENIVLSPQYLVSCSRLNLGCNGGNLALAWWYMGYHGIVPDSCVPYVAFNGTSEMCPIKCVDGTPLDLFRVKLLSIKTFKNPDTIKLEIMTNGPIETAFMVYQDFMYYKGGIYKHISGGLLGGHAVKIIGWGKENGTDYWLVANSWGTSWGEQGFFRIAFGECGIDGNGIAGQPVL
jgi:cathepsin B